MKHDLTSIAAQAKTGKGPRCLLLFGDDLQVEEARNRLIDHLVPPAQRALNLERYDGRNAPWDQIEGALMTPPFLSGVKVVWIENAPYFISREQRVELGEKVLQLWADGKREQAGKLLIDILAVEGWTQEQWERLAPGATGELIKLLGLESESQPALDAVLGFCKTEEIDLKRRRGAGSHGLLELLERGLPQWSFLLLTAAEVDRRMRLFKRFTELGAVLQLSLERERSGRISRESLVSFINRHIEGAGKRLEFQAREMIVQRAGSDLRNLRQELAKLCLYVGDRAVIRAQDVEAIFMDDAEAWVFDLTRAMGEADPAAALAQLARLIASGEHPLKLLAVIATEARRLLAARQLLDGELAGSWKTGMSYSQFQQRVLPKAGPMVTRNPYADYMCLLRADRFTAGQLRRYIESIQDADFCLKSSGGASPRSVMERLILGMCLAKAKRSRPARAAQ
jgi:DNA polymerase III delta subunit